MRRDALSLLACPACHGELEGAAPTNLRCLSCGCTWLVEDGLADLVYPRTLEGPDAASRRLWDRIGGFYDWIGPLTNLMRGVPPAEERRALVGRLGVSRGAAVLEIASGTGENLKAIATEIGTEGTIFGVDLSRRVIARARRKLVGNAVNVHLVLGNATRLPFRDGAFDAVLDGFGMKYYSDKRRAMTEMLRVVKPGGRVAIAELGVPGESAMSLRQRLLALWIPHFSEAPPLDSVPEAAEGVSTSWDAHRTAYTIEFRKREQVEEGGGGSSRSAASSGGVRRW